MSKIVRKSRTHIPLPGRTEGAKRESGGRVSGAMPGCLQLPPLPPPACSHGKGEEDPLTARVHGDAFALGLSFKTQDPAALGSSRPPGLTHHLGGEKAVQGQLRILRCSHPAAVPSRAGLQPPASGARGPARAGEGGGGGGGGSAGQEEAGKMDPAPSLGCSLKDVKWSSVAVPLDLLVSTYRLPQIARLDSGESRPGRRRRAHRRGPQSRRGCARGCWGGGSGRGVGCTPPGALLPAAPPPPAAARDVKIRALAV